MVQHYSSHTIKLNILLFRQNRCFYLRIILMVFIAACIHSLREGNVFSHVCLSVSLVVSKGNPLRDLFKRVHLGPPPSPPPRALINVAHILAKGLSPSTERLSCVQLRLSSYTWSFLFVTAFHYVFFIF